MCVFCCVSEALPPPKKGQVKIPKPFASPSVCRALARRNTIITDPDHTPPLSSFCATRWTTFLRKRPAQLKS